MFDHEARLERLLTRHHDAVVVEPRPGRPTLVRRDQILVADRDMPVVEGLLRRWYDSRHDGPGASQIRLRAEARVDVCELAAQLSGDEGQHRRLAVAPNHVVHGQPMWWSGPADLPWPTRPLPAPKAAVVGRAVTVAVLDTGLSPHPWYGSTDWYADQRDEVMEVLDADLDYELDAQAGHGTFIVGVLLQHAPSAQIRARKVIGSDGVGDELDIVRELSTLTAWAREHNTDVDVVNLSVGCYTHDDRPSPVVARAIAGLGRRTVVVACAGNAASDRPFWPAALKSVIAVAALDAHGRDRAWFSNYGWWVDACSCGERIASSFVEFSGARPRVNGVDPDDFQGYATWSGTSFAAPAVAGAIAGLAAQEDLPAPDAADRLLDPATARSMPDLGVVVDERSSPEYETTPMR